LAGFTAAITILEHGGNVILLDKSAFCGYVLLIASRLDISRGNSTKATSGISASETDVQKSQSIQDSSALFAEDVLRRGEAKPELARVLCSDSGSTIDWLHEKFGIELSHIERLAGHSVARTHRGVKRFTGMAVTFALMEMAERVQAKNPDRCRIVNTARVTRLLTDASGGVIGCEYETESKDIMEEFGPVILCTGGFGADYTCDSLLAKHRPDLMHLPSNNGEHCTGDGIKIGGAIGASTIDLESVQVHPMGLVDPENVNSRIKLLAEASLREEGGILIDCFGKRFCNETGRRDDMNNAMWRSKRGPYRLLVNEKTAEKLNSLCERYKGRGLMKRLESGSELAQEIGIDSSVLSSTFDEYNSVAKASPCDEFGKKRFNNVPFTMQETYYVALVTPVVHYCMGGLEIDPRGSVLRKSDSSPIPGLFAAGEVTGGVHGNYRLGGNSLLECLVFGRITGRAAVAYLKDPGTTCLDEIAALTLTSSQDLSQLPLYGMDEVSRHNTREDCWIVINGQVLDVTKFLHDHPGGPLAILRFAGKDASQDFNSIHPPNAVLRFARETIIGFLQEGLSLGRGRL
jgi:flavocytochrome c